MSMNHYTKHLLEVLKDENLELAGLYLEKGADVNYVIPADGVAAIHLATVLGKTALLLMLQYGGNPNVRSEEGLTPLHVAATWGDEESVRLLLQSGADPYIKDQEGYLALDVAKVYGHEDVYLYLKYYSLLLLSEDQDIADKYTRYSLDEYSDDNYTSNDDTINYTSDGEEGISDYLDGFINSTHSNNLYTNVLNKQLCHQLSNGNKVLFDVTSPDHPYMDFKTSPNNGHREDECQTPVSRKGNNYIEKCVLEDSFISSLKNSYCKPTRQLDTHPPSNPNHLNLSCVASSTNQNSCHHTSSKPKLSTSLCDHVSANHKSTYPLNHHHNIDTAQTQSRSHQIHQNEKTKPESAFSRSQSPLPELQRDFKHNNTLQWVSDHAKLYDKRKNSSQDSNDDLLIYRNNLHTSPLKAKIISDDEISKDRVNLQTHHNSSLHHNNACRSPGFLKESKSDSIMSLGKKSRPSITENHVLKGCCSQSYTHVGCGNKAQHNQSQRKCFECPNGHMLSTSESFKTCHKCYKDDSLSSSINNQTPRCLKSPENCTVNQQVPNSSTIHNGSNIIKELNYPNGYCSRIEIDKSCHPKTSDYSKRQYIKSSDCKMLLRRCRDERSRLNSAIDSSEDDYNDLIHRTSYKGEICSDSDSSSGCSEKMISDCFPISSDSCTVESVSDIDCKNRLAYKNRMFENKRHWLNKPSSRNKSTCLNDTASSSQHRLIKDHQDVRRATENLNGNNSFNSDTSEFISDLNTAHLSNTLPFDIDTEGSSQSYASISDGQKTLKKRVSDSSCDTFVTCDDGDPNRTISEENVNPKAKSFKNSPFKIHGQGCPKVTEASWTPPQQQFLDESNIYTSDESFIERKERSVRKKTNHSRNMGDLSDRLQSFYLNSHKQEPNSVSTGKPVSLPKTNQRLSTESNICSSEPSLISVSTPRGKNISPGRLSIASTTSALDMAFCGSHRPSLDSMFSTVLVKEYVYRDPEKGITLIERHVPSECGNSTGRLSLDSVTSGQSTDSQKTEVYDWKTYVKPNPEPNKKSEDMTKLTKHLSTLSNEEIRTKLQSFGEDPGPVITSTRQTYLKRLVTITQDPGLVTLSRTGPDYSIELRQAMERKFDDTGLDELEIKMVDLFNNSNGRRWREGALKSSFNYLLLDPRVTKNLPLRAKNMSDVDVFCTFIAAIFYVGKGKRSRPYTHLYEAISQIQKPKPNVSCKVQQILDIWSDHQGVVSLHLFQNVIPVEAYTREACIIQAFGLDKLTNKKRGDFYGTSSTWSMKNKRKMGVYFLKKALQIFLAEGERQICPPDIKMGQ